MNIRRILQIGAKIQNYHDIYNTQMGLFDLIIFYGRPELYRYDSPSLST